MMYNLMYNLTEQSKTTEKKTDSLRNYYRDEPVDPIKNTKFLNTRQTSQGKQLQMLTQKKLNLLFY